jgi:hypothetical protein
MFRASYIILLFSLCGLMALLLVDADDTPEASIGGVRRRGGREPSQQDGLTNFVAPSEVLDPSNEKNEDFNKLALDDLYKDLEWNRALGGYGNKNHVMSMDFHGKGKGGSESGKGSKKLSKKSGSASGKSKSSKSTKSSKSSKSSGKGSSHKSGKGSSYDSGKGSSYGSGKGSKSSKSTGKGSSYDSGKSYGGSDKGGDYGYGDHHGYSGKSSDAYSYGKGSKRERLA